MSNVKIVVTAIGALAGSLALIFVIAIAFGLMRLPLTNIDRVVTQHTLGYIQAHQQAMLNYYADWTSGDDAHKAAASLQVCAQAAMLEPSEYPAQVAPFIVANCH